MLTPDTFIGYYLIALGATVALWSVRRRPAPIRVVVVTAFAVYMGLMAAVTFLPMPVDRDVIELYRQPEFGGREHQLLPGRTIIELLEPPVPGAAARILLGNLVLLLPFGFLLPFVVRRHLGWLRPIAAGAGVSVLIEVMQFMISHALGFIHRTATTDDVLLNVAGCAAGVTAYHAAVTLPGIRELFRPMIEEFAEA